MRAIAAATSAAVALVGAYLALGGASYAPAAVADPCAPREGRNPNGFEQVAEQIVLSALDGAACELGTTREAVVLAFENRDELERFAQEHGVGDRELEELARSGLVRAIDDAEQAGALTAPDADGLRELVRRIPIEALLDLPGFLPALESIIQ